MSRVLPTPTLTRSGSALNWDLLRDLKPADGDRRRHCQNSCIKMAKKSRA